MSVSKERSPKLFEKHLPEELDPLPTPTTLRVKGKGRPNLNQAPSVGTEPAQSCSMPNSGAPVIGSSSLLASGEDRYHIGSDADATGDVDDKYEAGKSIISQRDYTADSKIADPNAHSSVDMGQGAAPIPSHVAAEDLPMEVVAPESFISDDYIAIWTVESSFPGRCLK